MRKTSKAQLEELAVTVIVKHWAIILLLVLIVAALIYGTVALYLNAAKYGAQTALLSYKAAEADSSESAYISTYDSAFSSTEEKWHLSNQATINIRGFSTTEKLEVLTVSYVDIITNDNKGNESWLLVPGKGVFTVDLRMCEFMFDNDRKYVCVRIPKPELTECSIDSENVQQLLFDDGGVFSRSIGAGVELVMSQRREASEKIQAEFLNNPSYYQSAKLAAQNIMEYLIKEFNLDIPDLVVEVEIME